MTDRRDHCRAVLCGQGLGDAIGELAFTHHPWEPLTTAIADSPMLRWTDDTAMARVLARHLRHHRRVDPQALGHAFAAAHQEEPWRGYGPGPGRVFSEARRLGSYRAAAQRLHGGQGSLGNGAAMRAAPVGLAFADDSGALDDAARAQASVTHAHPVAQDGAAIQARAVAEALKGRGASPDWRAFLGALEEHVVSVEMEEALDTLAELLEAEADLHLAAKRLGTGVAAHHAVPFALWCFLRHPDDWMAVLRAAVTPHGDRDTIAAMAGAVCAARVGLDGLPREWLERLEAHEELAELGGCLGG